MGFWAFTVKTCTCPDCGSSRLVGRQHEDGTVSAECLACGEDFEIVHEIAGTRIGVNRRWISGASPYSA